MLLRILNVMLTYFLGVLIEYIFFIKPAGMEGELIDYLFLFGVLVIPALFIFILPISLLLINFPKMRFEFSICLFFVIGLVFSTMIIYLAVPIKHVTNLIHEEILFFILSGAWFSVLYFLITEVFSGLVFVIKRKKAIQVIT